MVCRSSRRAVSLRRRSVPLIVDASIVPSMLVSAISTLPEIVLAIGMRPALAMRMSPLMVSSPRSPLMSRIEMFPEIDLMVMRARSGAVTLKATDTLVLRRSRPRSS